MGDNLNTIPAGDQHYNEKDGDILTVVRPAGTLPASTQAALFDINGGKIELIDIVGKVTTVIQTQANDTKLIANPASGSDTDVCAALNISADAAASRYSISGTFGNALINTAAGVPLAIQATSFLLQKGTLDIDCAATNTGAIEWVMRYRKIDPEAYVTAA